MTQLADAYSKDGKVWYWESNNAPCPIDACQKYGIPCDVTAQKAEIQKYTDEFLEAYRQRMENHVPDAEEMFEMQAAFGPGAKVVNIITGQTYTT